MGGKGAPVAPLHIVPGPAMPAVPVAPPVPAIPPVPVVPAPPDVPPAPVVAAAPGVPPVLVPPEPVAPAASPPLPPTPSRPDDPLPHAESASATDNRQGTDRKALPRVRQNTRSFMKTSIVMSAKTSSRSSDYGKEYCEKNCHIGGLALNAWNIVLLGSR